MSVLSQPVFLAPLRPPPAAVAPSAGVRPRPRAASAQGQRAAPTARAPTPAYRLDIQYRSAAEAAAATASGLRPGEWAAFSQGRLIARGRTFCQVSRAAREDANQRRQARAST